MAGDIQGQRHDRNALILYGSETGNSQDVAEELGRMAERLHFVTRVCAMDLVEINVLLKYTIVIFALSTTGQGEFPENARKFWKSLLRKRLPPNCLGHMTFTTFGLGDSSYPQFNFAARKLHKRLEQLGAKEFYPRGEADEQHEQGIDGTFLSWSVDIRKHILSLYPLPDGVVPIPAEVLLPPKLLLVLQEQIPEPEPEPEPNNAANQTSEAKNNPSTSTSTGELSSPTAIMSSSTGASKTPTLQSELQKRSINTTSTENPLSNMIHDYDLPVVDEDPVICSQLKEDFDGEPHEAPETPFPPPKYVDMRGSFPIFLMENKRMTPINHWQDVRQLTFYTSEEEAYDPGDILNIMPKNFPEDVQTLIDLMGWNDVADKKVSFVPTAPDFYAADNLQSMVPGLIPTDQSTLRDLLIHNLDITAIPKRHFFQIMSHYTTDLMHRDRLLEYCNPAFTDEFYDYTSRPRRGILEVLQDFPSVKLPWAHATELFPLIRPRKYSISSGGAIKFEVPDQSLTKIQLLVAIVKYKTVLKKVRQGLCSRYLAAMPAKTNLLVTITEGSLGLAAARPKSPLMLIGPGTGIAPLRSLIWERAQSATPDRLADTLIFYGGRNKRADNFYSEEWGLRHLGVTKAYTAFSRDQKEKIYVQDIIRQEKKEVWRMLKKSPVIVVCGSSGNMPKAVREAIIWVMLQEGGPVAFPGGREDVEEELKKLEKAKFYVQETW